MPCQATRGAALLAAVILSLVAATAAAAQGCVVTDPGNLAQTTVAAAQTVTQVGTMTTMATTTSQISDAVGQAGSGMVDNVFNASSLSGGLNAAAGDISGAANAASSAASSAAGSLASQLNGVAGDINSGIKSVTNDVGNALSSAADSLGVGSGSGIGQALTDANNVVKAGSNVVNATNSAIGAVTSIPGNALGTVMNATNKVVNSPINSINQATTGAAGAAASASGVGTAASAYSSINNIINGTSNLGNNAKGLPTLTAPSVTASLQLPFGNGQSVSLSSLARLAGGASTPTTTATSISSISVPGLSAAPTANFSTISTSQSWVNGSLFVPNGATGSRATVSAATAQGLQARRDLAVIQAAQTGYALALTTRANATDADNRAAALMAAGNSAQDMRGQLAALQVALTVLQGELATIRTLRASQLEIQAAQAVHETSLAASN